VHIYENGGSALSHCRGVRHPVRAMGLLFESFLVEFLKREQMTYRVTSPHIQWKSEGMDPSGKKFLPQMKSDIVLSSLGARILIEAKCTGRMTYAAYQGQQTKLRSQDLYQLLNYLQHLGEGPPTTGLLLYAQSGVPLSLNLVLAGHRVQVRSLD
jgi:5-methylcytosine-specific restriction endonuclease McrBC regulatory subunit McrC